MTLDTEALTLALEGASFAAAITGAVLAVLQRNLANHYRMLAIMFACLAIAMAPELLQMLASDISIAWDRAVNTISVTAGFLIGPASLGYVRRLTGYVKPQRDLQVPWHITPAVLACVVMMTMPSIVRYAADGQTLAMVIVLGIAIALYGQILIYSILVLRVQMQHRTRLKDLFASTEPHEVRWVIGIAALLCLFTLTNLWSLGAIAIADGTALHPLIDALFELAIVSVLILWGLRQIPGHPSHLATADAASQSVKYDKSALDTKRATRIAGKLHTAMERDELYKDASLSLWTLSHHIGVSTNYVSQTLNEHIERSFFDYVNGWRVEAAKPMILKHDMPIAAIAYEVGFNSRSSFYTAFRKNTGTTPSAYAATEPLQVQV